MTDKPRIEVALLRLFRAAYNRDCTPEEALECFAHTYGGERVRLPSPKALLAEMRRDRQVKREIVTRAISIFLDD